MRMFLAGAVALLLASAAPGAAQTGATAAAGTYRLDQRHASVTAKVSHLGLSKFTMVFHKAEATLVFDPKAPRQAKLEVTIDPTSVDTGVAALDTELAGERFFNAAKFPQVRFASSQVAPTSGNRGTVAGQLTMLGVTRPVTLDVTFNGAGTQGKDQKVGFSAITRIKRSDFGMTALVGPVGDVIDLAIEAEFIKQP